MAEHIRLYAAYLWELCTAPVIPFCFDGVAGQFCERLELLAQLDGVETLDLKGALAGAQAITFTPAATLNASCPRPRNTPPWILPMR